MISQYWWEGGMDCGGIGPRPSVKRTTSKPNMKPTHPPGFVHFYDFLFCGHCKSFRNLILKGSVQGKLGWVKNRANRWVFGLGPWR
jgi:hypothetical protein